MINNLRAHVVIFGKVQGVFFRWETKKAADRYGILGWVKNKSDGTVEAVFEGKKEGVEQMLKWCHKGSPNSKVSNIKLDWETYQGDLKGFEITY